MTFSGPVEPKDPGPSGRAVVIVADGNIDILSSLQRVFRNEPYDILVTDDTFEALARIQSRPVEVVIADEFLPGMFATDLLQAARRQSPGSALIVLARHPAAQGKVDLALAKSWEDERPRSSVRRLLATRRRTSSEPEEGSHA